MEILSLKYLTPDLLEDADIIFEFENCKLHAHSIILRMQSKVISNMINDIDNTTKNPLIFRGNMLNSFCSHDLLLFLTQIYNFSNESPTNYDDAYKIIIVADMFDSLNLLSRCVQYIKSNNNDFIDKNNVIKWLHLSDRLNITFIKGECIKFLNENLLSIESIDDMLGDLFIKIFNNLNIDKFLEKDSALKILLLAEKINNTQFIKKSINFIAKNYESLKNDPRFLQISISSYHKIALKIQDLFNSQKKSDNNMHMRIDQGYSSRYFVYKKQVTLHHYCLNNDCKGHTLRLDPYDCGVNDFSKPNNDIWNYYISSRKPTNCYGNLIKLSDI